MADTHGLATELPPLPPGYELMPLGTVPKKWDLIWLPGAPDMRMLLKDEGWETAGDFRVARRVEQPADDPRQEQILRRLRHAVDLLSESVDIDPERRGGIPVLRGTRFKLSQIIQEMVDGNHGPASVADDMHLSWSTVKNALEGLSIALDVPHKESANAD